MHRYLWMNPGQAVEATTAMLDRIAAHDPKLKSYATVTPERALADAARLDAESAAGRSRGPLHGVPIAVKDLVEIEGEEGRIIFRQPPGIFHVTRQDGLQCRRIFGRYQFIEVPQDDDKWAGWIARA